MTPSEMLAMARDRARRMVSRELQDDLASVASLAMVDALQRGASKPNRTHMLVVCDHAILNEMKKLRRRRQHVAISIHHAVTELIDEWKRAPVQEEMAMVSEVRRIAAKALTPPQLDVVMARAHEESHRQIAIRRRWSVGKAVKLEQDGMAALCDAVDDD